MRRVLRTSKNPDCRYGTNRRSELPFIWAVAGGLDVKTGAAHGVHGVLQRSETARGAGGQHGRSEQNRFGLARHHYRRFGGVGHGGDEQPALGQSAAQQQAADGRSSVPQRVHDVARAVLQPVIAPFR